MNTSIPIDRGALARRGRRLEYFTIAWNSIEAVAALISGILAGSIALVGFGLDSVINAIVGAVVVCVSLSKLGIIPTPMSILLYIIALGFGVAVHYSIMLSLAAVSFWIIRAQGLVYGYFNFLNIARYPDVIYPWLFRLIFGWIIPVVIVANIPARLLIKSLGQPAQLMLQLVVASSTIFFLSRAFWRFALRHYSSASS